MLDKSTEICLFLRDNPKRASLLKEIVTASIQDTSRRIIILDLCKTWSMRQEVSILSFLRVLFLL